MQRLLLILVLLPCFAAGQNSEIKRTWHWFFGYNAGLDFSNVTVVADTNGALSNLENCATMSDTAGNLLFYSNGDTVWNANHSVMLNGDSLMGCWSSSQGVIIVPKPNDNQLYYLFTLDCGETVGADGLRYNVIDMTLDGGLGGVTQKNIFIEDSLGEKITGCYHDNGQDVWLVVHEQNSNRFLSYLLSATGVNTTPVVSATGTSQIYATSYMKISPDKTQLAMGISGDLPRGIEVLDFDNSTGSVGAVVFSDLSFPNAGVYGVSFSPDNSRMYATGNPNFNIYQYDITLGTPAAIIASKTNVGGNAGALQIGADGKIYAVANVFVCSDSISVINNPNALGLACNLTPCQVPLDGKEGSLGLPNFIESYFYDSTGTGRTEVTKQVNAMTIHPNPTTGMFTVQGTVSTIQVYDLLGNLVLRTNKKRIDMGSYPSGIYLVRAGEAVHKLILH